MRIIITILMFGLTLFVKAQSVTAPMATDFTLTDINGEQHNLYSELSQGKTVVLDFFSVSCGPCADGVLPLNNIYVNHGSGSAKVLTWAIECFAASNETIANFMLDNGGTFPAFSARDNDTILDQYGITYTPTYFVICPNKVRLQTTLAAIEEQIGYCESVSNVTDPLKIKNEVLFNSSTNHLIFESVSTQEISVTIFNATGQNVYVNKFSSVEGLNSIYLPTGSFGSGIYFLHVFGKDINSKIKIALN